MRVLMITPFPSNPSQIVGGVAGVAAYLSRQLADQEGVKLEVLAPQYAAGKCRKIDFNGICVRYIATQGGFISRKQFVYQLPHIVAREAENSDAEIIHVQGITPWTKLIKKPSVFTVHGIPERDFLHRKYPLIRRLYYPIRRANEQRLRRGIANIISISPYVVKETGGSLRGRIWEIENPVRDDFFDIRRQPIPGQVLYGGVISERKNVAMLLSAISLVRKRHPNVKLRIAGHILSKSHYEQCLRIVREQHLESVVEFLGTLDVSSMKLELSRASALALCSWQETAPLIIEEAMAAGVPVVASNRCGMPFMIKDGKTGRLVEPGNVDDIANGIVDALVPHVNEKMSQQSKAVAENRFRASVIAAKTAQVYREILRA